MDKPAFQQLQAQLVKRPPVESLRATGGCTLEIHRQVLKGRLRGQRADASTGHAEAFAADSCSDLLVFLLNMNNAPFVIDSVFISLSLIKGAYQSETWVILWFLTAFLESYFASTTEILISFSVSLRSNAPPSATLTRSSYSVPSARVSTPVPASSVIVHSSLLTSASFLSAP